MSHISVRNLWMEYGDKVVLEQINLEIEAGTFCAVVGPSGCGKSTFLRLLLSQETPTRGEILMDGEPIRPEPGPDRGVVFQRYSVFPHLSVLENVILGLEFQHSFVGRCFGRRRRQLIDEARHYLAGVGLDGEEERQPHELSGGMRQRLSIAQALIRKPKVLLLDEPFGALDPGTKEAIHSLVRKLWTESKMTILLVTHDLSEGFKLGSRLIVFDKLRVDEQAPERYGAGITYDLPLQRENLIPFPQSEYAEGDTSLSVHLAEGVS